MPQRERISFFLMNSPTPDPVDIVIDVCERASQGDFEARLSAVEGDERIQRLCRAINHLLDVSDAYVRESAAAMPACLFAALRSKASRSAYSGFTFARASG